MNESSAYLWNEIQESDYFDENTLADLLTNRYSVSQDIALSDSKKLISEWEKAGIIEK